MADKYVWTSTDPTLIADFERWQREYGEFWVKAPKLVRRWFGRKKRELKVFSRTGGAKWLGVECLGEEWRTPPAGWKYDAKHYMLTPLRSKKEGKQFAAELDGCQPPREPNVPGMPAFIVDSAGYGIVMRGPSLALIDGVMWCWWKVDLKAKRGKTPKTDRWHDPKIWTRAKLSEFYAAKESQEVAA